ncbi:MULTISPECIES: response regulator transcription factor [Mucilaginibacter]|uniref:response regulator transcription factor n=1 Tax=Mucilaginibacter TaxID=423349 RepID=UPI002090C682|nr:MULTISPECIES: response regulator transcription factor [Mucilaginibacter]MEB0248979.1 response regulator transcription factor [Mucilaginibacter sp. 5B2]MCO5936632.1 response regulator transcription factor [Mucilaginibacter aurantiaciroseus]MEB0263477.1 response regulator transcription factor [Mucilaginibacter sp. 10I4]MEB0279649.1 response regulator transcription factor [Mucilaginibacter sp. 10B2]MEB0302374.1 response regulator transcription factor [Mucilaginibacter sp. 5C4]
MNILIVEDEKALAHELELFLVKNNYICEICYNGASASEKLAVNLYDFILLDLGLPDYEGLDLLREAKKANPEVACIILTARAEVNDRVKGLDLGADDYLAKPFSLLELQSRMQAIIRRKFGVLQNIIDLDGFLVNITDRTIMYHVNPVNTITKKEFDLIAYMLLHKNRTLTRAQLSEHIWGSLINDDYDSNFIDAHIKNIRKKLSFFAPADWLETVRGLGYRIKSTV